MPADADGFHGTGRFVLEGRLGEGGMGVVHRVRDVERGEVVALKTMGHVDSGSLLRFKREFRALADISHPNVVQLYELFSEGDRWFFTMELVAGCDFLTWVHSSPSMLRDAFRQLASGVQAIHAAGKLHRDIKPSNVMVAEDGRVVLLDFGVVAEYRPGRTTVRGDEMLVGTPAYMAPEQAAFQPATPLSDWYAVGVILFESLTRRMPFEGSTSDLLLAKQRPLTLRPSELVADIPPDLERLCVDLLKVDPRDRPPGDEVIRRLEGNEASSVPSSLEAPFVGRRLQLDALRAAFDACLSSGAPVVVMLRGRSGMGKSALALRFLGSLSMTPGALVLSGRCYEREAVPFKAVDQVIDELSRWLARLSEDEAYGLLPQGMPALIRLFPVLRNASGNAEELDAEGDLSDPVELRRRAFAALKELLVAIASRGSLVIHVDDLQWGDADSVQLLETLLSPPAPRQFLLLCGHRSDMPESTDALGALRSARDRLASTCDFRDLEVGALTTGEARELASALLDSTDASIADSIATEACGNPLFAAELARWANEGHGHSRSVTGAVALEQVILARVAKLPADARTLLEAVSLARGPIEHAIAEKAAGLLPGRRTAAIALRTARFVSTRGLRDGDLLDTCHDRIREAISASLGEDRRRGLHRAIAYAIASSDRADPQSAFEHFRAAGDDDAAREYALRAADAADRSLAFLRAAALYRIAIALRAGALDLLHAKLGDALANAGRGAEAADAYMEAAEHAPAHEATGLRRTAAEYYLKSGRDAKGLAVLREVLAEVGIRYPESTEATIASIVWQDARLRVASVVQRISRVRRAQSLSPADLARIDAAFCAATGLGMTDPLRSANFGLHALRLAIDAGEPVRLGRALAVAAANLAAGGESSRKRAGELVRAAQRVAAQVDDAHGHALALLVAGMVHFFLGEWQSALTKLGEADGILRSRCRAVAWELTNTETWICNALFLSGQLRKASARIPALLEEARARDDRFALTQLTYPACCSYIVADDVDAAWRVAQYASTTNHETFAAAEWGLFVSSCSVERYKGDGRAAWERAQRFSPAFERSDLGRVAVVRAFSAYERGSSAVAAASQMHDRTRALRVADRFARQLVRERVPYAPALGQLLSACAHATRGDRTRAIAALDAAIPRLDSADLNYLAACARHRRGELGGAAAGSDLIARSRAFFDREGVKNVQRCLAMSAPGFESL